MLTELSRTPQRIDLAFLLLGGGLIGLACGEYRPLVASLPVTVALPALIIGMFGFAADVRAFLQTGGNLSR